MSAAAATFTAPGGEPAGTAIRYELQILTGVTIGDLLYVGHVFRARIRQRTLAGIDVNGAPFRPYSTKGPYYFYPNRDVGSTRRISGTRSLTRDQIRGARATAAANRFAKTARIGIRTPFGIRYESYAAAKAAHGVPTVNLYGMEQHTHMLDTMVVKVGGMEIDQAAGEFLGSGSDLAAFEQNTPANQLLVGFYGPEAERAKGQNEGNSKTPARKFFALNADDLALGERAIAERQQIRAARGSQPSAAQQIAVVPSGPITDEDLGF
jgi:hypothetical protein